MPELTLHLPPQLSKRLETMATLEAKDPETLVLDALEHYLQEPLPLDDEYRLLQNNQDLKEILDTLEKDLPQAEKDAWLSSFNR
jgi:hypothetical protein